MNGFVVRHAAHLIVMGVPFVLLAGMFAGLHLTRPDRRRVGLSGLSLWLALAWIGAATTHLVVIGEHFEEAAVLGVFFLVLTAVQYAYAAAVLIRCSPRLLALGLLTNASVVLLWAYTRTVAIPFGLGEREGVGLPDIIATGFEAVAVVLTAALLRRGARVAPPSGLEPETLRLTVECSAN